MTEYKDKIIFFVLAASGAVLDIVTKVLVFESLGAVILQENGTPKVVGGQASNIFGDTLRFACTVNTGAVFSLFRGRWVFLVVFTLISMAIILYILFRRKKGSLITVTGLALVCAGAVGNLWDRIFFNGVRDFIDFKAGFLESLGFAGGHWPTFNVADIWICVGIGLIFLGDFILHREPDEDPVEAAKAEAQEGSGRKKKKKGKKK